MKFLTISIAAWGAAAALAAPPADHDPHAQPALTRLQLAYLACDRLTSSVRVDATVAQRCSAIGERLLQHGFGGDFDRLLAWRRDARAAAPLDERRAANLTRP